MSKSVTWPVQKMNYGVKKETYTLEFEGTWSFYSVMRKRSMLGFSWWAPKGFEACNEERALNLCDILDRGANA